MTKLRVYSGSVTKTPSLRVYSGSVSGSAPVAPKLRVYSGSVAGAQAIVLAPLTDRTVEPLSTVSITAVAQSGSPTSYSWRRVSGPTDFPLTGTGATVTTIAPAALAGATLVLGVTATDGTTTSAERLITITSLPQLEWAATASGWVARAPVTIL